MWGFRTVWFGPFLLLLLESDCIQCFLSANQMLKSNSLSMEVSSWEGLEKEIPNYNAIKPREYLGNLLPEPPSNMETCILYRDRNGWCPYSERVWLGLLHKQVKFDEVLINLQGMKPSWYYSEVSTGNTPAIRFADGTTMSESLDLLSELDEKFPSNPSLFPSDPKLFASAKSLISGFRNAMPKFTRPSSRGAFLFRSAGGPIFKAEFEDSLDKIERLLSEHPEGPFFLGSFGFSAVDCAWAPFLERWAIQLPLLHKGLHPRETPDRWPRLKEWYNAMDSQMPSYLSRVRGDPHTWSYVLSDAAGGALAQQIWEDEQNINGKFGREEDLLLTLKGNWKEVWESYRESRQGTVAENPAVEAAQRILLNKEAIIQDILKGCSYADEKVVDKTLRLLVQSLIHSREEIAESSVNKFETTAQFSFISKGIGASFEKTELSQLLGIASFFSNRICTPRDMGILPARHLKAHLQMLDLISRGETK